MCCLWLGRGQFQLYQCISCYVYLAIQLFSDLTPCEVFVLYLRYIDRSRYSVIVMQNNYQRFLILKELLFFHINHSNCLRPALMWLETVVCFLSSPIVCFSARCQICVSCRGLKLQLLHFQNGVLIFKDTL